ncbi:hypothetical protein ACYSNR_07450 [Enterococcus sp. LJL128]
MKELFKLIEEISFPIALDRNTMHKVYFTINKPETELLPKSLKISLFGAVSLIIGLFSKTNGIAFPIISALLVFFIWIFYFKSLPFFRNAAYAIATYLFTQNAVVFYFSALKITSNPTMNIIISSVYILTSFLLSFYIIKVKLIEAIKEKYLPENELLLKMKSTKHIKRLMSVLFAFLLIVIGLMQFYRINKSWLSDLDSDFLSGLNGSLFGNILSIFSVIIGVAILMLVTILPTLIINSESIIDGLLLKKFSEEFRQEYEFTKNEWYG